MTTALRTLPRLMVPRRLLAAAGSRHLPITFASGNSSSSSSSWRTQQRRGFAELTPTPVFTLTETEELLKESVARFAKDEILPKVREMDEAEQMDRGIVSQLFEQGLMGIEIPEKYGGSEMNFGACIVAIEELARVDPSVAIPLSHPPLSLSPSLSPSLSFPFPPSVSLPPSLPPFPPPLSISFSRPLLPPPFSLPSLPLPPTAPPGFS